MQIKSLNELPATRQYLSRIGAELRSLKTAVIKQTHGKYWKDIVVIKFDSDGTVRSSSTNHAPDEKESILIKSEFAAVQWPKIQPLARLIGNLPDMIANAEKENLFEFRDLQGMIAMVQVRIETDDGKAYIPWTHWDDGEWRRCEPDGALPLFNAHLLKEAGVVFIHEGAKAARFCQAMVEGATKQTKKDFTDHPWGIELDGAVHLGWIGGAMSPYRTDWSPLAKAGITRAYIVSDNDEPGRAAVPQIAYQLNTLTFAIQFTDEFPASFDLADPFPEKMFALNGGVRNYIGPKFRECLHPATWATDEVATSAKGKPAIHLRDAFKKMWLYIEEADLFVCREMPEIQRTEIVLNKMLAAFSHTNNVSHYIVKAYQGRTVKMAYNPGESGLIITDKNSSAINLHVPSSIRPTKGDPGPWLEFIDYLLVNATERKDLLKWCATLIAKPATRMTYGLLLISERQGIGKTTLGAAVLSPLVGRNNVGYPRETDIVQSAFNDWLAQKRLIVINEIYSGSSWKAYHALKSVIADKEIMVNQKYVRPYTLENWAHIFACSNSMRALKMEDDDRRWFYPEISESPWPMEKFVQFRKWIETGGLGIIRAWADNYGWYVSGAERAPMTWRKREMIEGSRSDAQREAAHVASAMAENPKPSVLIMSDLVAWVRNTSQGRVFETDYELRRVMREVGLRQWGERVKIGGRKQHLMINEAMHRIILEQERTDKENNELLRKHITRPQALMEEIL